MNFAPLQQIATLLRTAPRRSVAILMILMTFVSLTEGFGIMLLVPLLNGLIGGRPSSRLTYWLNGFGLGHSVEMVLSLGLVLIALRALLQYVQQVQSARLQHLIIDTLRLRCFAALMRAEWRWLAMQRTSDHASALHTNIGRIGQGFASVLMLAASLVTCVAYGIAAVLLSWRVALLAFGIGVIVHLCFARHRKAALVLGHDMTHANRQLHARTLEGLASVRLTKILGNEARHTLIFADVLARVRAHQVQFQRRAGTAQMALQIGGATLLMLMLYLGLKIWQVPLAQLLPLIYIFARVVPMTGNMQQSYYYWLNAVPALSDTQQLLADCSAAAEPPLLETSARWSVEASVQLVNVTMTYTGRTDAALRDVSLVFPARTTTAILGASGAGKSTLADILIGLLAPDSGQLVVDRRVVDAAARRSWRQSVAYVQQDAFLFHDSVRNNLRWARADADEAMLRAALKTAAADFVFALPEGLETIVGDGGVRLSGGERQRLALARALLGSPALLILDEATSALDPVNEAAIRRAIELLHGNVTLVIIGHRLAMLESADQVVHLDNGVVVSVNPADVGKGVS